MLVEFVNDRVLFILKSFILIYFNLWVVVNGVYDDYVNCDIFFN